MQEMKKKIRTRKGFREYSYLGCPLTRNRSAWCFRLCKPDAEGNGRCGRIAPHSLKSNIQSAIEKHGRKQVEKRLQRLERSYLNGPVKGMRGIGIRLAEGEADIVLPLSKTYIDGVGGVSDAVCFKLMSDSAVQAINSLSNDVIVLTSEFSFTLTHSKPSGDLIVRGRYVGMAGNHYLADTMLTDAEGNELGRGEGVLSAVSDTDPGRPPVKAVGEQEDA